jgi:hypothetical protein
MKASNDYVNNMHFTDRSDREKAFLKSPIFALRHRNLPATYLTLTTGCDGDCTAEWRYGHWSRKCFRHYTRLNVPYIITLDPVKLTESPRYRVFLWSCWISVIGFGPFHDVIRVLESIYLLIRNCLSIGFIDICRYTGISFCSWSSYRLLSIYIIQPICLFPFLWR